MEQMGQWLGNNGAYVENQQYTKFDRTVMIKKPASNNFKAGFHF